jgi:hypothetical protein
MVNLIHGGVQTSYYKISKQQADKLCNQLSKTIKHLLHIANYKSALLSLPLLLFNQLGRWCAPDSPH